MASQRLMDDFLSDDSTEEIQEGEEQTQLSRDASQTLYLSDENDVFELGDSVSNKRRSIELESDLSKGHESESEDDKKYKYS